MVLILILAVLLLGVAVGLGVWALVEPRARRSENLAGIDAYGYSSAAQGGVKPPRKPIVSIDEVATSVGDFVARRIVNFREERHAARADLGRLLPDRRAPVPRVPGPGGDHPADPRRVAADPRRGVAGDDRALRGRRVRSRLGRPELLRAPQSRAPPHGDRRRAAGTDRSARRDARGGGRLLGCAEDGRRATDRPARRRDSTDDPGAGARPLDARGARELAEALRHARRSLLRPRDGAGRPARRLDRNDPSQPGRRDAGPPAARWSRSGLRRRRSRSSSRSSS